MVDSSFPVVMSWNQVERCWAYITWGTHIHTATVNRMLDSVY